MGVDRSYVAQNRAERERLRALIDRLSDSELGRPLDAGWTVAASLAHVAFWDQRTLVLVERWEQSGPAALPRPFDPDDVDWINDASKALCLALPPRAAARLALATAEAIDRKLEALPDALVAANAAAGSPVRLSRADHRRDRLDEIERVLASS